MPTAAREIAREEAEKVAGEVLAQFAREHPELRKIEIPPPLKWAGGIVAALGSALVVAFFVWLTSAVNSMQVTVARIDERQEAQLASVAGQIDGLRDRVSDLEEYHKEGGR